MPGFKLDWLPMAAEKENRCVVAAAGTIQPAVDNTTPNALEKSVDHR